MFKIEKDSNNKPRSLFISDKEIELEYCYCHKVRYGVCKLGDLKLESGIDYPNGIHLLSINEYNLCSRIEIQKVESGRMLQIEYLFLKDEPEPDFDIKRFANFNLFFSSPDVLDKFKKRYAVEQNEDYIRLSRKINLADNIYQIIKKDLNYINSCIGQVM